jgi:hypothetical protein
VREADPWRKEIRPERHNQEHRQALKTIDDLVKELSGCRIEPVCILEHNQHSSPRGESFKLREKCTK